VDEAVREVGVIGAPLDLGAGRRGVDMGPSAIRYAGLEQQLTDKLGVRVFDAGNVSSPVVETTSMGDSHARYLAQILAQQALRLSLPEVRKQLVGSGAGYEHDLPSVG